MDASAPWAPKPGMRKGHDGSNALINFASVGFVAPITIPMDDHPVFPRWELIVGKSYSAKC